MASHIDHHVFLSYARVDDQGPDGGPGWVSALADQLARRHERHSGRTLQVFFDREAIGTGRDWRRQLGEGIRRSRLFLAFLSPNYAASENCLWEWEQYMQREHSSARGDDGITPVFFVTPADLVGHPDPRLEEWLADVQRRNRRLHECELHPWFARGPAVLAELDAAERSAALKQHPRGVGDEGAPGDLATLAQRLEALDRHIAQRLDRIALADLAPTNVRRSHEHFVGRHRELAALHDILTVGGERSGGHGSGGYGLIAAAHSPGGLGKTALARQYAHAYAESYAAGGTWEVRCEGAASLGQALLRLTDDPAFLRASDELGLPFQLTDAQREDLDLAAAAVLDHLDRLTLAGQATLRERLARHAERHSPEDELPELQRPRCLLLLDNVDDPALLGADQLALMPTDERLEVLVTTRLDPAAFGADDRWQRPLEIEPLPDRDGRLLIREFQEGRRFATAAEEQAADEIVAELQGFTLALELVAAYLGAHAREGYGPSEFLARMRAEGLTHIDDVAGESAVAQRIRHEQMQVGLLVTWALDRLSPPALAALRYASVLMPDDIPLDWLRMLTATHHATALETREGYPDPWAAVWSELHGLRLLHPVEAEVSEEARGLPRSVRIHRVIAEHVAGQDDEADRTVGDVDTFLLTIAGAFERQAKHRPDELVRAVYRYLKLNSEWLLQRVPSPTVLRAASVVCSWEGSHHSLAQAIGMSDLVLRSQEELLRENPASPEALRDVSISLCRLGDLLQRRSQPGDADKALGILVRSSELDQQLMSLEPTSSAAAQSQIASLQLLGDFLSRRRQPGDLDAAIDHYRRCVRIADAQLEAEPTSFRAARNVGISLQRLAGSLAARGQVEDLETASAQFERSVLLAATNRKARPESMQAASDYAGSLEAHGDFIRDYGENEEVEGAKELYMRALALREDLLSRNGWSRQAARCVASSQQRLADLLVRQNDQGIDAIALSLFGRSIRLLQTLLDEGPDSLEAARDLAVVMLRKGDLLARRGQGSDVEQALEHYQYSLSVAGRALRANPGSLESLEFMVASLDKLAALLDRRARGGDAEAAIQLYEKIVALASGHGARDSSSSVLSQVLPRVRQRLGDLLCRRGLPGDAKSAIAHYEQCLEMTEAALSAKPDSAEAVRDVAVCLRGIDDALLERASPGDAEHALSICERLVELTEELLANEPGSRVAALDCSAASERLARALMAQGTGSVSAALPHRLRSAALAMRLHWSEPTDQAIGEAAARASLLAFQCAHAAGQLEVAASCLLDGRQVLMALMSKGVPLSPAMQTIFHQLEGLAGGGDSPSG